MALSHAKMQKKAQKRQSDTPQADTQALSYSQARTSWMFAPRGDPGLRQKVLAKSPARYAIPPVPQDPDFLEIQAHRASLAQTCLNANKGLSSVSEDHPTPVAVQPLPAVWKGPRSEHPKASKGETKSCFNDSKIVKPKLNAQGFPRYIRTK